MNPQELLARFSEQHVLAFALVLARVAPLFLLAPLFSSKSFPARVRGVTAVALAIGISPVASHAVGDATIPADVWGLAGLMAKEVLVGMAFSFGIAALFAALTAAGAILDLSIGFMLGGVVDPLSGTQSSLLQQLYTMIGVLVFIAIGGDGWVIAGLARTYDAVPLLASPDIASLTGAAQLAFKIAMPLLLVGLVIGLLISVFQAVTQIQEQTLTFIPKIVGMGVVLVVAGPWMLSEIITYTQELYSSIPTMIDGG